MSTSAPEQETPTAKRPARAGRDYLAYIGFGIPAALLAATIIYFMNAWFDSIGWGNPRHPTTASGAVTVAFIFYAVWSAIQRYWLAIPIFFVLGLLLGSAASYIF
jgi:hypothetical protein